MSNKFMLLNLLKQVTYNILHITQSTGKRVNQWTGRFKKF